MSVDLFGNPIAKPVKKRTQPNGYAAEPGTGPKDETCRTCKYVTARQYSKTYYKCALNRRAWTGGLGSDIRLKSPACFFWKGKE